MARRESNYTETEKEDIAVYILTALSEGLSIRHGIKKYLQETGSNRAVGSIQVYWSSVLRKRYRQEEKKCREEGRELRDERMQEVYSRRKNAKENKAKQEVVKKEVFNVNEIKEMTQKQFTKTMMSLLGRVRIVDESSSVLRERLEQTQSELQEVREEVKRLTNEKTRLQTEYEQSQQELNTMIYAFSLARKNMPNVPKDTDMEAIIDKCGSVLDVKVGEK